MSAIGLMYCAECEMWVLPTIKKMNVGNRGAFGVELWCGDHRLKRMTRMGFLDLEDDDGSESEDEEAQEGR